MAEPSKLDKTKVAESVMIRSQAEARGEDEEVRHFVSTGEREEAVRRYGSYNQ